MSDRIFTCQTETRDGNTLSFFYNPDNDLLVVDLITRRGRTGNELVRWTLDEPRLLSHATRYKRRPAA